jgi:hypothetical protein
VISAIYGAPAARICTASRFLFLQLKRAVKSPGVIDRALWMNHLVGAQVAAAFTDTALEQQAGVNRR